MKITEITYSFSCKINLGNYESCDIFAAAKSPVDPTESADKIFDELREWVKEKIRSDRKTVKEK